MIPGPYELRDLPKAPDQFARRTAVGILATDRAPCRNVAGTPPGSDVRSWLGVRFIPHPFCCLLPRSRRQNPAVKRSAVAASTKPKPESKSNPFECGIGIGPITRPACF